MGHVYHHERAQFLQGNSLPRFVLNRLHAVLWSPFHSWLEALLQAGYRPALKASLDAVRERTADAPAKKRKAPAKKAAAKASAAKASAKKPPVKKPSAKKAAGKRATAKR